MRTALLSLFLLLMLNDGICQTAAYWQQQVNYRISVSLNEKEKALDGMVDMTYFNQSPDTLRFIWIHLWPNAYKNDQTAFSEQLLKNGNTAFYFADASKRGYINRLQFTVDSIPAIVKDHPQHQDIVQLLLPAPLLPGKSIRIQTPFHVQLPYNFSRGGYEGSAIHATQWYPKPAVYDNQGWHPMPYLDQGEFYSEFGNYHVIIDVSDSMRVAASGTCTDSTLFNGRKAYSYQIEQAHDFAWFADARFLLATDTLQMNGRTIAVQAYHYGPTSKHGDSIISHIKSCVRFRSRLIGDYPYPSVTVVEKNTGGGGGMEYPTITLIDRTLNDKELDLLIEHEVGHNWFYGILANNERDEPWLDEGINTYFSARYEKLHYPDVQSALPHFIEKRLPENAEQFLLKALASLHLDQPITSTSEQFNSLNYGLVAYEKTALWVQHLEKTMGTDRFDSSMHQYFSAHRFQHVSATDFKKHFYSPSDSSINAHFSLLAENEPCHSNNRKKWRTSFLFNFSQTEKYHTLQFMPMAGYNQYDRFMLGAVLHNISLPGERFQFIAVPLYSTGTRQLNGIGKISFGFYPSRNANRLNVALGMARFTRSDFTTEYGKKIKLGWNKWVPEIKYSWQSKDFNSKRNGFIQWKTYFISEGNLLFEKDSVTAPYRVSSIVANRTLHQLRVVLNDRRKLYPYTAEWKAESGKGFIRLGFTGDYFFNYPKGGGLEIRCYAGKFFYTGEKSFNSFYETNRYHLNTTGSNGFEDYTYSDYFIGRNEFEGMLSRQIMRKDGFFKVRTDLLSQKVGQTDNWLAAINLTSTIPAAINPLELLPFKIPLKLFIDIGTNNKAGKVDGTSETILYDAGLQLSLLNNTAHLYLPVLCSRSFRDYNRSVLGEKKFWKTISFSIDLRQLQPNQLISQLNF